VATGLSQTEQQHENVRIVSANRIVVQVPVELDLCLGFQPPVESFLVLAKNSVDLFADAGREAENWLSVYLGVLRSAQKDCLEDNLELLKSFLL
jgi:hypothetical protein